MRHGELPTAGLALVDQISDLAGYPWWHATRAELLQRVGQTEPARSAYQEALALGMNDPHIEHLRRRLAEPPEPTR
jgi:predicted RNA polymerase sigma factor